ncbi:MAG: nickel/cobalt transporter [Desulfovibrio sp.]
MNKLRLYFFVFVTILTCSCIGFLYNPVYANPFLSSKNSEQSVTQTVKTAPVFAPATNTEKTLIQSILQQSAKWQRTLKHKTSSLAREIKNDPWGKAFWLFLGLSFFYGSLHALGPGHGKGVCCAWVATRNETKSRAALMATVLSTVHVSSATITVSIAAFFLGKVSKSHQMNLPLEQFGYGLLILIGLILLVHGIKETFFDKHSCDNSDTPQNPRAMLWTAFATGLVPCPAAALVLGYALMLNVAFAGYGAMLTMALGMSMTTALFAVITAGARQTIQQFSKQNQIVSIVMGGVFHIGGPLVILALGWILLSGTMIH